MINRKQLLILVSVASLIIILIPIGHLVITKWNENKTTHQIPQGFTNDESHLNLTPIDSLLLAEPDSTRLVQQLRSILAFANKTDLKVSIAGAKHSMGGHTMTKNGIVINMLPYNRMSLDTTNNILTIGSGALWRDALIYLDKFDKSVFIMQAFSSFSVGGSVSVNGHGWQKNLPPLAHSIESFTLMDANGDIVECSRTKNSELFKLVIGGYGLFGIILDVKLKVVDNQPLKFKYVHLATENYLEFYNRFVTENANAELVFGRLRISNKNFLEEATLNYFEKTADSVDSLELKPNSETTRLVFRGSVDSEYGKRLRWDLETGSNSLNKNSIYSRNDLLNDDVSMIENKDTNSTDILHEYFIPERHFNAFIEAMKHILITSEIDLLNITIRRVDQDTNSFLNYAREDVYGFVLLFNQKKTANQEQQMMELTRKLVYAAIEHDGTYYLPYRLHISPETMNKVYPQATDFFKLKLKYDPNERFSNKFYEYYK